MLSQDDDAGMSLAFESVINIAFVVSILISNLSIGTGVSSVMERGDVSPHDTHHVASRDGHMCHYHPRRAVLIEVAPRLTCVYERRRGLIVARDAGGFNDTERLPRGDADRVAVVLALPSPPCSGCVADAPNPRVGGSIRYPLRFACLLNAAHVQQCALGYR